MRYFLYLSFDGTSYHGWQIQPNGISVQETLQGALATLLQRPVEVVGAGRTDTGVHARLMVAHFDLDEATPRSEEDCAQLVYRLNKLLPRDISVAKMQPVADDMHARFSATRRTYQYFLHLRKAPFLRHYSWQVYGNLDFDRMNEAAQVLLEYEDFASFSKVSDVKTTLCRVYEARWEPVQEAVGEQWRFTITANRFLRNMVRAIVGTLIEVGRGRMSIDEFRQVIERRDRCSAGESVPPNGLFLVNIEYN